MTAIAQQINFLIDDLKPRHEWLTARHAIIGAILLSFVLIVWSIADAIAIGRAQAAAAAASEQLASLAQITHSLEQTAAATTDPQLLASVETLRSDRATRIALLDVVGTTGDVHARGFSGYLDELAQVRQPDLWLTRMHFESAGDRLELEGSTLDAAHVPAFLMALNGGDRFRGHKFDQFEIARETGAKGSVARETTARETKGPLRFTITGPARAAR
jgi:hypothetical protein